MRKRRSEQRPALCTPPRACIGVGHGARQCGAQALHVSGWHEQTGLVVDDTFAHATDVGGHHRKPIGERLDHDVREAFPGRAHDHQVGRLHDPRDVRALAEETHPDRRCRVQPPVRPGPRGLRRRPRAAGTTMYRASAPAPAATAESSSVRSAGRPHTARWRRRARRTRHARPVDLPRCSAAGRRCRCARRGSARRGCRNPPAASRRCRH